MTDLSVTGRFSGQPAPANTPKKPPSGAGFDAALTAARETAAPAPRTAPAPSGPERDLAQLRESHAAPDLDKLRLEAAARPAAGPDTLADRCLAALDRLEAGTGSDADQALLRRAYREMVEGTGAEYGHLPPDDLTRILAMYDYARREEL